MFAAACSAASFSMRRRISSMTSCGTSGFSRNSFSAARLSSADFLAVSASFLARSNRPLALLASPLASCSSLAILSAAASASRRASSAFSAIFAASSRASLALLASAWASSRSRSSFSSSRLEMSST